MSGTTKKVKTPRTGGYYTTKLLRRVQEADPELMKSEKAMKYFRSMNTLSTELDKVNAERTALIDKLKTRSRFLKTLSKKKEFLEQLDKEEKKEEAEKAAPEDNMEVDQTGEKKAEEAPAPTPEPEPEVPNATSTPAVPDVSVTQPPPAAKNVVAQPPTFEMPNIFGGGAPVAAPVATVATVQ